MGFNRRGLLIYFDGIAITGSDNCAGLVGTVNLYSSAGQVVKGLLSGVAVAIALADRYDGILGRNGF
jgi:hypothetical protein